MDFEGYRIRSQSAYYNNLTAYMRLAVIGLSLTGETGEIADRIKKYLGHGQDLDLVAMKKELGDVLWYIAEACTLLGFDMGEVAEENVKRLEMLYPEGFFEARMKQKAKSSEENPQMLCPCGCGADPCLES